MCDVDHSIVCCRKPGQGSFANLLWLGDLLLRDFASKSIFSRKGDLFFAHRSIALTKLRTCPRLSAHAHCLGKTT